MNSEEEYSVYGCPRKPWTSAVAQYTVMSPVAASVLGE